MLWGHPAVLSRRFTFAVMPCPIHNIDMNDSTPESRPIRFGVTMRQFFI
jgi:hypothetical protein